MCGGGASPGGGAGAGVSSVAAPFSEAQLPIQPGAVSAAAGSGVEAVAGSVSSTLPLLFVARVLGSPHLSSPCSRAPVYSQPESGVLGSLRTRGWAGAESSPPRSLLPLLAAWPHPAWPSHSAPEARGLRGLRGAACSACAHAFCSNCFPNQAAKPGSCCRGPGKRGAWALRLESIAAPSRPRGVRSPSLKPQSARPEPILTSRVKATRGISVAQPGPLPLVGLSVCNRGS